MVRSEGYSTERQRIIAFGNMRMPTHKLSQASALIHVLSGDDQGDGFTTKLLENGVSYRWNRGLRPLSINFETGLAKLVMNVTCTQITTR